VAAPPAAAAIFGARLPLAQRYAELLTGTGIEHGLLGPREAARIWDRHLLNCAVLTELLPGAARVVDVGSGAGLPGLVLAIRRPDLRVDLVESLRRRVRFLTEAVTALGLHDSVRVVHGRAEDAGVVSAVGVADWVTARAVAPLDRLTQWCLPLLRPGGVLLAMKGDAAQRELDTHQAAIRRHGGASARVVCCGQDGPDLGLAPVPVVVVRRAAGDRRTGRKSR
jgi:16S rRNA (guanine527-N7)-methyltransferase